MSWEGQKMKSKRLSFNRAISRDVVRRCWPLWAAYLGYLFLSFSTPVLSYVQRELRSGFSITADR